MPWAEPAKSWTAPDQRQTRPGWPDQDLETRIRTIASNWPDGAPDEWVDEVIHAVRELQLKRHEAIALLSTTEDAHWRPEVRDYLARYHRGTKDDGGTQDDTPGTTPDGSTTTQGHRLRELANAPRTEAEPDQLVFEQLVQHDRRIRALELAHSNQHQAIGALLSRLAHLEEEAAQYPAAHLVNQALSVTGVDR